MINIIATKTIKITFGMNPMNEKLEIITSGINITCMIKEVQIKEIKHDKILLFIFPVILIDYIMDNATLSRDCRKSATTSRQNVIKQPPTKVGGFANLGLKVQRHRHLPVYSMSKRSLGLFQNDEPDIP